jgi:uncharacterized membrane protein YcaP (DUF421 family)
MPVMTAAELVDERLATSWAEVGVVALSTVVIFAAVIGATRIVGLRSLSKMSAFDFAMTVAVGSLMATVAVTETSLLAGLVGLSLLYATQFAIAQLRRSGRFSRIVDNQPTLLMVDGEVLQEALDGVQMTRDDLRAKLREANVLRYDQVRAVVMETTGDVSVLHGSEDLDPGLLRNVVGAEEHLGR